MGSAAVDGSEVMVDRWEYLAVASAVFETTPASTSAWVRT